MKRVLGLAHDQRVATPLAFVVGKSDTWEKLLSSPLEPVVRTGALDLAAVRRNSDRVRAVLLQLCPGLVASAESLAEQICFFAATSFGHTPVMIGAGSKTFGQVLFDLDRGTVSLGAFQASIRLEIDGRSIPVRQQVTTRLVKFEG